MVFRGINFLTVITLSIILVSCNTSDAPLTTRSLESVTARDLHIVMGQTIYVPAYSEIFYGTSVRTVPLAVTLAIHNTDVDSSIIIQAVRYYDTDGNLVREYVNEPVEIPPLATTGFIVESQDTSGGWGANFIVEWGAEEPVYEPIVEAIMISTEGNGVSMISPGRIVSEIQANSEVDATSEN